MIRLVNIQSGRTSVVPVGPNGAFADDDGIPPGRYRIVLVNAPGYCLAAVSSNGNSYRDGVLTILRNEPVQLSLRAAWGASNVDGVVLRNELPVAGAMVLVIPKAMEQAVIARDQSDSDGTFTLRNVPPGQYTLIAIDDGTDLSYAEPGVIVPYLAGGRAVSVPLRNEPKLKVAVQSRQK